MDREGDFLSQYRTISNKLKKRFLKKPNVAEGSEQFGLLAKSLKSQGCPHYAGFCCLAQARCENNLSNVPGEAQALLDSARSFLEAQHMSTDLCCPSFQEHLCAAVNCYSHVIRVYIENKQPFLAAAVCLELGCALTALDRPGEAIQHYQMAAELQCPNLIECLTSLGLVASNKIEIKDFEGALSTLTDMTQLINEKGSAESTGRPIGIICDILAFCEVTRVLLLMLLQPTPERLRREHAETLEKYAWSSNENIASRYLTDDLFLLLQSVVMACQSRDCDSLSSLQTELWPLLNSEQNELLHLIITELSKPSGEGV